VVCIRRFTVVLILINRKGISSYITPQERFTVNSLPNLEVGLAAFEGPRTTPGHGVRQLPASVRTTIQKHGGTVRAPFGRPSFGPILREVTRYAPAPPVSRADFRETMESSFSTNNQTLTSAFSNASRSHLSTTVRAIKPEYAS